MTTIGVLGVGRMGRPIASRLRAGGHAVSVFDLAGPVEGFENAQDAVALAASVDILMTVLPGRRELADAAGIIASLRPSALWLDLTSGDPRLSDELALAAPASVAAPMGGGPAEAAAGTLTFFVGGSGTDVARALPVLQQLGRIERAGDRPGDGQTMKLLANLLWFGQAVAVTETMLLGRRLGLQIGRMRDILPRSAGASTFMDGYLDRLLSGDYVENFGLDRVVEELETLTSLADGMPFELSSLVARLHREALERFGPVQGELLVAKLLEQRGGGSLGGASN
jgi:3-hydroxyisobutyrate dehydrogenase